MSRRCAFTTIIAAGFMLCAALRPVPTHAQWAGAPPLPRDADLDAMLAAHDWNALGAALSRAKDGQPLLHATEWLHAKIEAGGGILLTMMYSRNLWAEGERRQISDPHQDTRIAAAGFSLYTYALIVIDGAECEDRTAPPHRIRQLLAAGNTTFAFARTQPESVRETMVKFALSLEQKTAKLRGQDDLICRDGTAQTAAALKYGQSHDGVAKPGPNGKQALLEAPPGWKPQFVPASVYGPMQDKARLGMKLTLSRLVGLSGS